MQVAAELSERIKDMHPLSLAAAAPALTTQFAACLLDLSDAGSLRAFDGLHDLNTRVSEFLTDEAQIAALRSTSPDMHLRYPNSV